MVAAIVSSLSSQDCWSDFVNEGFTGLCDWKYNFEDGQGEPYQWGCVDDRWEDYLMCEYAKGECIYVNTTIIYTGCYDETYHEDWREYINCCDPKVEGNDCNHETIDTDLCVRCIEYETIHQNCYSCLYEDTGAYRQYVCDDYTTEITGDAIEAIYSQQATCSCAFYSGLYRKASAERRVYFEAKVDSELGTYSQWNEMLGCDIDISCDLSSGTINGATLNPSTAPT